MLRKLSLALGGAILAGTLAAGAALAADPPGSGQPNQSCQAETSGPPGLLSTTNGFATRAVNVYAGSGQNTNTPANLHAVSQYDVACFEVSQH